MKLKNIIILLIVSLMMLPSCNDDLNVENISSVASTSMWKDKDDAEAAMYGLYNQFRSAFSWGYIFWGEYRTGLWGDGLISETSRWQVFQNQIPTNHTYADWTDLYTTINDANLLIKYTPSISFKNETEKNTILANAYFVRAFCYYWIGRIWGDAPILLNGFESDKAEDLYPTRNPAVEVFKQVENDIQQALSLMPDSINTRNLASPGGINMLRADYDLWMYKVRNAGESYLNDAKVAIQTVLNDPNYSLEDDYSNIFDDNLGSEIIFAWSYIQDEYEGGFPTDYLVPSQYISSEYINNPVTTGSHQQWEFLTPDYEAFLSSDPSDTRTKETFETFYDPGKKATFQWINKYKGHWINDTRIFDSDIIVYRLADAILFDAEIKMYQKDIVGATKDLNVIARRAYKKENYYHNMMTADQLKESLVSERKKEFGAEGKLWWDFIRLGVAFKENPYLTGRENENNVLLWPISQSSINKNPNLKQTPGYDK